MVSSVAVLAMGLYLWREVNATPAPPDTPSPEKRTSKPKVDDEAPAAEAPERDKQPTRVARPDPAPVRDTASRPAPSTPSTTTEAPALAGSDPVTEELAKPNPKLDMVMAEANKAYDHGEFDEAKGIAMKVLAKDPNNVRMLRIAVSASCIEGDPVEAQKHYNLLPGPDREAMKIRCGRYGVSFTDPK